jgi:hypothetical protein
VGVGDGTGVGAGGCDVTGGLEDDELIGGTDSDEAAVDDEAPSPPHPARAPVATTIASQRLATIDRIICVMKTPQRIPNASAETC